MLERKEIMFCEDVDELVNDVLAAVAGACDGFKENTHLSLSEKGSMNYDAYLLDELEVDKTGSAYVDYYNTFFNANVGEMLISMKAFRPVIQENIEWLKNHFDDYVFAANAQLRNRKLKSEKKIYYSEMLAGKLQECLDGCDQREEDENCFAR